MMNSLAGLGFCQLGCGRKIRAFLTAMLLLGIQVSLAAQDSDQQLSLPETLKPLTNTASDLMINLGEELFFDKRLSGNDKISCASCHDPDKGFSNGERFAIGFNERKGTRHVPSLINVGYSKSMFWDGRTSSLEEQALLPIQSHTEMNMSLEVLVEKLSGIERYEDHFQAAFHGPPTSEKIASALAAYQRTIVSPETPFDRYLQGDQEVLTNRAVKGMKLFFGQARCFICHRGPELTDHQFHNIGVADPLLPEDAGRQGVTARQQDYGAFRTPQLREIGRTAPYMHNGRFRTLKEVVEHYNFAGVTDEANDHRDELLEVLYLNEDNVDDLVEFLRTGLTTQATDEQPNDKKKTNILQPEPRND